MIKAGVTKKRFTMSCPMDCACQLGVSPLYIPGTKSLRQLVRMIKMDGRKMRAKDDIAGERYGHAPKIIYCKMQGYVWLD